MHETTNHEGPSQTRISSAAVEAAVRLGRRLGIGRVDPVVLRASRNVSIRLAPLNVVARAIASVDGKTIEWTTRELNVARHLVENGAPVVGPSTALPAGPHVENGFVLTLWEFVEHEVADADNGEHVSRAAEALRRVHQALAGFRDELPDFWCNIDDCGHLLKNETALAALPDADRDFLLTTFNRLRASASGLLGNMRPIHGDAHLGNAFITPEGARWNDFEDVCLGPREWDISWLPETGLAAFAPLNRELLSTLRYMHKLCISVWCWDQSDIPEKREAAENQLAYLRESCPS
jgi:aminoglycoside phosphotransferase (APT) family kinase protein